MAVQTVPKSVNIDNVYTPWLAGVARASAVGLTSPMPAVGATNVWTERTLPVTVNWNGVAYGNQIFLAVSSSTGATGASNYAASSIDGITWATRIMPVSASWGAITFGNGTFVAVADGSTTVATTTDGFTWNTRALERSSNYRTIWYGGGQFITLGFNSSTAQVSTDGSSWSYRAMPASRNWTDLTYDSSLNRWVAVASNTNKGAYSNDGSTWVEMTMIKDTSWNSVTSNNLGRFVAVTNAADTSASYSDDGITWYTTKTLGNAFPWQVVSYMENYGPEFGRVWSAMSNSTRHSWSNDGINWTQTAAVTARAVTDCVYAQIPWRTNDTLTINNEAVVTVNTDQDKFWSAMTITSGTLNIVNNSSTNAIRFVTGRVSGAAAQAITPSSAQGKIIVSGNWIDLSVGTGLPNQEITVPYTDYISALWVETGVNSSTYEIWLNVMGPYGGTTPRYIEGLQSVSNGQRGKFFIQKPNTVQNTVINYSNVSTNIASRTVILPTTAGIYTGAQIIARATVAIPASSVVERIIDGSTLEINVACTVASSSVDVSIYNPYSSQLLNTVVFGDGVNGNKLTEGVRVRIPNIMLTSDTPANMQTASAVVGMSFVTTNGPDVSISTCLMDEVYNNFTQPNSVTLKDVGMWNPPTLTKCYNVNIDGLGFGLGPIRRFYGTTGWIMRDVIDSFTSLFLTKTFLDNMIINNLVAVKNTMAFTAGSTAAPVGMVNIAYSSNVRGTNFRLYKLQNYISGMYGIVSYPMINDSNFTNIETYGMMPVSLMYSSNNTFTNLTYSHDMFNMTMGYSAGQRLGYDPITDQDLVDNTPYYFKVRNFFTRDRLVYVDSSEFSSTPFLGSKYFPDYFTCYCNASKSVLMAWPQRAPYATTPSYEIYRGTTVDFVRDSSSRVFSTNTAATVTWTNTLTKPTGTAAATRNFTFDASSRIVASGSAPGNFQDGSILVGDTLIVTGTNLNNRNYTVKSIDSSLIMTMNEPMLLETAYAATATFTSIYAANHQPITASASRWLTFNSAKTISASCAGTVSFLADGYIVGDVVEITGCTSPTNNGTKTISVLTPTVMTVLEPLATEAAYTATATITGKPIENNTTYYYVLRKYDSSIGGVLTYSDSAPQEVYVHDPNQISTNRLLQNNVFGTTWTATNVGITSNVVVGPLEAPSATTATSELLIPTVAGGNISQRFGTAINASYNFSVFVASMPFEGITTTNGKIQLGNASTNFVADVSFSRVNITYLADASSLLASIIVPDTSGRLLVTGAMANLGTTPDPPITTTTAPVTNVNSTRYPILMRPWCRSYAGETHNSGIEVQYHATTPTGTVWTEVYCSSTRGFTPSIANRAYNITTVTYNPDIINIYYTSYNNIFDGITQINKAFASSFGILLDSFSQNNIFKNASMYLNYPLMSYFIYPINKSDNTFIHNWNVDGYRNYVAIPVIYNSNTASGLTVQNLRMNNSDNPIGNTIHNTIIKGLSAANAGPASGSTSPNVYTLGGSTDGIGVTYTAVYDTIFNELYFDGSKGALHVLFNASLKNPKPYTLFGATSEFSNTGRLYLQNASDGIEYTWPHTILGVSGFRAVPRIYYQDASISGIQDMYKVNGVDLGTTIDLLEGLKIEYDINKGSGYTGYRRCISSNMLVETISSSTGFNLKLRLTAMPFMKYGTKSTAFLPGETVTGRVSRSTAKIVEVFEVSAGSALGTIWVSDVSGTFLPIEIIESSTAATRATNVATNTFPFGPSYTSYIDGLQIYTFTDTSVLYSENFATESNVLFDVDGRVAIKLSDQLIKILD